MPELELIHGDRRADRRYQLQLDLLFSYESHQESIRSTGYTVEISKNGILFSSETPPPNGAKVELRIRWPFLLQNVIPLQLVMRGKILRTDRRGTVLQVHDYAFRTCGAHAFDEIVEPERLYSITA